MLAGADEQHGVTVDEDLRGAGVVVVRAGHGHAIGAGGEDGDEIALGDGWERAVGGEEVGAFADGADDIAGFEAGEGLGLGHVDGDVRGVDAGGPGEVVGLVERGADELVHAGVDDDELLGAAVLDVLDAGEEDAGVADDGAAGLEEDAEAAGDAVAEEGDEGVAEVGEGSGGGAAVVDAEAAAEVEFFDVDGAGVQVVDEGERGVGGFDVGGWGGDGGAEVDVDAAEVEVGVIAEAFEDGACAGDIDAELVFFFAGGGVLVGFGVDVGVDAEGGGGADAEVGGDAGDALALLFAFGVESADGAAGGGIVAGEAVEEWAVAAVEGGGDFFFGFADAGEGDAGHGSAAEPGAFEFTTGDDVHSGAEGGEEAADVEVAAGFEGVAEEGGEFAEGGVELVEAVADFVGGVGEDRGSGGGGDAVGVDAADVEVTGGEGDVGRGCAHGGVSRWRWSEYARGEGCGCRIAGGWERSCLLSQN